MPATAVSPRTRFLLRPVRAVLRPLATHSASSPIETIVLLSVVGTLAYFHILSAIKHSAFFAPAAPSALRPAHALLRDNEWVGVRENAWFDAVDNSATTVEMQQLIFSLDPAPGHKSNGFVPGSVIMDLPLLQQSMDNITDYLTDSFPAASGRTFSSICHRPALSTSNLNRPVSASKVNLSNPLPSIPLDSTPCFITETASSRSKTLTLSFLAGNRDDFVSSIAHHAKFAADTGGVRFIIENRQTEAIGQMKSGKWVAYAVRALVLRFWDLAKKANTPDILIILAGYILMHSTFIRLFLRSRSLGSNFWLPTAIVSSSVLALLISLPLAMWLRIPMEPVALTEALPFLVCTVGFDKPLRLAKAVLSHPHVMKPSNGANQMKPAAHILIEALAEVCNPILRDYVLEIAVLCVGAYSGVGGLREVCALAAILLAIDCMMMGTFLVSILEIMIEVQRIKSARDITQVRSNTASGTTSPRNAPNVPLSLRKKFSSSVLGVKGSMLSGKSQEREESPVARLKLLLIVSFLTLHIMNLVTPLSPPRYNTPTLSSRKVDITTPGIRTILTSLAQSEAPSTGQDTDLFVKISAPIYVRVVPPPSLTASTSSTPASDFLENFMSSWTRLVGDPVLSKWIVIVLAMSVTLNGYLLKGIALGLTGKGKVFGWDQKIESIVAPAAIVPEGHRPTFSLQTVNSRLKKARPPPVITPPSSVSEPSTPVSDCEESPLSDSQQIRPLEELIDIWENGPKPSSVALALLNDEEVIMLAQNGKIAAYALEKVLGNLERAVKIRRALISRASNTGTLEGSLVPMKDYDYSRVMGACCENVVGYIPLPLGIAGPLKIDGELYPIPMATAEGTLVASTSRGCKALNAGGGVTTVLTQDGMTRGPAIDFPSVVVAAQAKIWIDSEKGYATLKEAFESTSRFAKLQRLKTAMAGRTLFVRFATTTGDAMGMNMISKGTEKALEVLQKKFPDMVVLALSGNYCTDKKPAAINWIEGRGKSIVAEAVVPGQIVKTVLKTTVESLCNLNTKKNLVGSAMAGSIGGFNAHAANILTAVFLATGQDPAQNVESSNCITLMEPTNNGEDLLMTVSMPSIEVGTVGGGTVLAPQQAVLEMLGLKGAHPTAPGHNSQRLARVIAAAVMAGELSLLSALAAGHLIRAHMAHNRSQANTPLPTPSASRPPTPSPYPPSFAQSRLLKGPLSPLSLTPSSSTSSLPPYTVDK